MVWSLIIAGSSFLLFVIYATITSIEAGRGERMFAGSIRSHVDHGSDRIYAWAHKKCIYVSRYVITLSWYYSLHAFLVVVLKFLARVYHVVESIVLRNRDRAKIIRKERKRSHLTEIAEHQEATALSPKERAQRKKSALEGK